MFYRSLDTFSVFMDRVCESYYNLSSSIRGYRFSTESAYLIVLVVDPRIGMHQQLLFINYQKSGTLLSPKFSSRKALKV